MLHDVACSVNFCYMSVAFLFCEYGQSATPICFGDILLQPNEVLLHRLLDFVT